VENGNKLRNSEKKQSKNRKEDIGNYGRKKG
jgi:hypothetical protein